MIETLSQLFLNTSKSFKKDDFILHKKEGQYVPISTDEFESSVRNFSLGLKDLGHTAGERIIILAENSPKWFMADFANVCLGGVTVPIHTVLSPEQIKYVINNSDAKIVVCSSKELWEKIEAVRQDLPNVTHYITLEAEALEGVLTLEQVQERGKKLDQEDPNLFEKMAMAVKPDDLAAIIYTSGTTGTPKGVMLTHGNFVSNVKGGSAIINVTEKDTGLSFLPVSHTLERIAVLAYFYNGCTIAFAESMETLRENLLEIRPQLMASAPRIFERIYSGVMDKVLSSSPIKRKIFFWALDVGKKYSSKKLQSQPVSSVLESKRKLAHKLAFSKIIALTGGNIRIFLSGGAPLSKDIAEFFHAVGLVILEGYGLTETSPIITLNSFDNMKFGSVGKPIPEVEVKIAEDGEILTRGPHVMKGYYKMEEETQEVFDGEWFCTGDIGYLDEDGFLVITDRKKDIIVTSGGKNVAPQQIENLLKTNPYISNAMVIGDRRRFISALIVPNIEKLEEYSKDKNISFDSVTDLIGNERIVEFMLGEVQKSTPNLASYETVKKIALLDRDFEISEGEITPTLKVKRNIVEKKYQDLIDSLYEDK